MPDHVAIIMDGNGRWATQRGLSRLAGHKAGLDRIRSVVKTLLSHEVKYVTLYGFSSENWNRPEEEVKGLFNLFEENIYNEAVDLHRQGIKMCHLGRLNELPEGVQKAMSRACALTQNNTRMVISFAINYGGKAEIVNAVQKLINQRVPATEVDEKLFASNLYTVGMPDVDLVIRTGGELRISGFLLWQSAYAEYYFTKILWPDFTPKQVERALSVYSNRHRRFGKV